VLGVDPARHGQGIGRRMAEAMFAHFRELGAQHVRTLVDGDMEGIGRFFGSLGFTPSRLRPFERPL